MINNYIGITERGDPSLDLGWMPWVQEGKPAILITKNPGKLLAIFLKNPAESKQYNIIIHATITGMGGSLIEPNVPPRQESLIAYKKLIDFFVPERVVLRIDPIIPTESGIELAKHVIVEKDDTRVRISFIDLYPHVQKRFKDLGIILPWNTFHAPLDVRKTVWEELGSPEICGEPGFECTGCVSELDCRILNVDPLDFNKGQRKYCACLANKKELLTQKKRCPNLCTYCYWT
jgi:hypothetical protein